MAMPWGNLITMSLDLSMAVTLAMALTMALAIDLAVPLTLPLAKQLGVVFFFTLKCRVSHKLPEKYQIY